MEQVKKSSPAGGERVCVCVCVCVHVRGEWEGRGEGSVKDARRVFIPQTTVAVFGQSIIVQIPLIL